MKLVSKVGPIAILALGLAAFTPVARPVMAQSSKAPVLIAVIDNNARFKGAAAVIIRRISHEPHDVIAVFRDSMRPSILSEAMMTLLSVRDRLGATPTKNGVYRVATPTRAYRYQNLAAKWIDSLYFARPSAVPGVGEAATIVVYP